MKKLITVIISAVILVTVSTISVSAEESSLIYDLTDLYSSISEEAKESLDSIGAGSADANLLSEITFDKSVTPCSAIPTPKPDTFSKVDTLYHPSLPLNTTSPLRL